MAGQALQRCRTAFLDRMTGARNVLTVGEGNGRFLCACRGTLSDARITVVDGSQRMLSESRSRLVAAGFSTSNTEFVHANALEWQAPIQTFDLIITHFFLDCFTAPEIQEIVARLALASTPSAQWLIGDFFMPDRGWRRNRAFVIEWMLYRFFRAVTGLSARRLVCPDPYLEANGFKAVAARNSDWDLLRSTWWIRRGARFV